MSDNKKFDLTDYATRILSGNSAAPPAMNAASPSEHTKECDHCEGSGSTSTGIDEYPETSCNWCDGTGEVPDLRAALAAKAEQPSGADVKAIHTAVLAIQCDPRHSIEQRVPFLAGVHRAAAVVSQFASHVAERAAPSEKAREMVERLRHEHKIESWNWDSLLQAADIIESLATSAPTAGEPAPADLLTDALAKIQGKLKIMLASATALDDGDCITGYQIKNGALHQILGVMAGVGYGVTIPLPGPTQQAASKAVTEFAAHMRDAVIPTLIADRASALPQAPGAAPAARNGEKA
jgi:hypothetical protein